MYPVLRSFGPFLYYSYTIAMGLGLLAGVGLTAWRARERPDGGEEGGWLDGVLVALAAALVGGRIAYVAANWDYFQIHLGESWFVLRGGLSYHGGLLAGLAALALWAQWRGRSALRVGGLLAPGAALWSAFGWLACWLEGCAYGRETFIGPLAGDLPDSYGIFAVRYQTQLLGVAFSLLALGVLWRARRQLPAAGLFWLGLALLSGGRFFITLLRGDPMPMLGAVRMDTLLEAILTLVALVMLFTVLESDKT